MAEEGGIRIRVFSVKVSESLKMKNRESQQWCSENMECVMSGSL